MNVTTIGIDLAKSVFSIHGTNQQGRSVVRKWLNRPKLLALFAQLPSCLIGMEACSGAHYWARELTKLGHDARIIWALLMNQTEFKVQPVAV
jgi:transposase